MVFYKNNKKNTKKKKYKKNKLKKSKKLQRAGNDPKITNLDQIKNLIVSSLQQKKTILEKFCNLNINSYINQSWKNKENLNLDTLLKEKEFFESTFNDQQVSIRDKYCDKYCSLSR